MKKLHVAFFCLPHPPHVNPALSIVSTLVRRGHRVSFVTSKLFASKVSDLGAEVIACPSFIHFSPDGKHNYQASDLFRLSTQTLSDISRSYESVRPDVILYDRVFLAGRILANKRDIPAITTTPVLAFEKATLDQLSEPGKKLREMLVALEKSSDVFLAQHGVTGERSIFRGEKLNIYFYPAIYQISGVPFDQGDFYAGRCAAERPYQRAWRPVSARDRPTILVSMSTAQFQEPAYFKVCIDALAALSCHVLLATGDYIDPRSLGSLPHHVEVVQSIPLIEILPHVNLLVFQGGPASTVEAMYHGVPLVMITPGQPDLESYAENAVRLGLGIHLRKHETTVESVRISVSRVLEDSRLADRVNQVQSIVRHSAGAEDAANRIEEYV